MTVRRATLIEQIAFKQASLRELANTRISTTAIAELTKQDLIEWRNRLIESASLSCQPQRPVPLAVRGTGPLSR